MEPGGKRRESKSCLAPTLDFERGFWERGLLRIVGVDEAGIGSLCGPVIAAAVRVPAGCTPIAEVRDSKTLSLAQRERLFGEIHQQASAVGVGAASVAEIARLNVRRASHLAMRRALARVAPFDCALIDGAPIRAFESGPFQTVVDGDARCYAIACASIIAKVVRDRLMARLASRFPAYGWDHNAGYGTGEHLASLRRCGLTPYHRRSYRPVRAIVEAAIERPLLEVGDG